MSLCALFAPWQGPLGSLFRTRKYLANHKWFTTAWVNWVVEANPPRSLVRTFCSSRTLLTAVFTLIASSLSPRCWSILAEASKMAVGFATLRPVKRKKHSVVSLFYHLFLELSIWQWIVMGLNLSPARTWTRLEFFWKAWTRYFEKSPENWSFLLLWFWTSAGTNVLLFSSEVFLLANH